VSIDPDQRPRAIDKTYEENLLQLSKRHDQSYKDFVTNDSLKRRTAKSVYWKFD